MPGPRIRTVKPEWLEDEQLLRAGSHARVLSIALILVADDYGRGRCIPEALAAQVFPFEQESSRVFRDSLASLSRMGFVGIYRVRDQQYFQISNWTKHQRVDKPGKPRVPAPNPSDFIELETSGEPREVFANGSRQFRESLAPDLDLDLDQEQERRGRAIRQPGSTRSATGVDTATTPTAAASSSNGENGEAAKRVTGEDVAQAWAETIAQPGANPEASHSLDSWRKKFETIAAACNAVHGKPSVAMHAVIEWFWLAPNGPVVQKRRMTRDTANPGHLARYVTRDLSEAKAWWLKHREAQHPRSPEAPQ